MADLEFEVAKRRTDPITFRLGGDDHEYSFVPPKSAIMLLPVFESTGEVNGLDITRSTFDWLGEGLSEEDNKRILDRLKDPKDDLDIELMSDVIQQLTEKAAAGRPTT